MEEHAAASITQIAHHDQVRLAIDWKISGRLRQKNKFYDPRIVPPAVGKQAITVMTGIIIAFASHMRHNTSRLLNIWRAR